MRSLVLLFCSLAFVQLMPASRAESPHDLLLLKGNVEIGFGQPIPIDPELVKKLEAAGYRVTEARDFQPLTQEALERFVTVIWINPSPFASGMRYYMPASWQGGLHMTTVERNAAVLRDYVAGGGGLLINLSIEEIGMGVSKSHQELLAPYGLSTECAQVRDRGHAVEFDKVLKIYPRYMHWTEAIAEHPATAEVKRIYYPGYTMRWDDNVTTLPLYPQDAAWTSLVKAEPTATVSWFRGTPYEKGHWKDATGRPQPTLVAARDFGKGRLAVTGIGHFFLYYFPYSKGGHMQGNGHWEANFGFQDGYVLEKGDGDTSSDMGRLLLNLYEWLGEPARERDYGGYGTGGEPQLAPIPKVPVDNLGAVWAQHDPMVTGEIRPMKVLVGARSAVSDGSGTPAEWAAAAKQAGIDVVAFTERYEAMDDEAYLAFSDACRRHSDDQVHLLPGLDVMDALGNRFLIVGKEEPIRPHLLAENEADEPGRRLIWTGHLLLGMGDVLPIAARPGQLATLREKGALPHELLSHVPGIAVATYDAEGKQIDDGRPAYEWQAFHASLPIPVAVHEVTKPADLARAAASGLHSYVNSDTPAHAAYYFRQGFGSFGGNPMRYYVSSGPVFTAAAMEGWDRSPWTLHLAARSETPITDVTIRDQRRLLRHYRPGLSQIDLKLHGDLGAQHWLLTELKDAQGGTALLSTIRTLPERHFIRCGDRQNWFGTLHMTMISYTGRVRSLPKTGFAPALRLPGVELPEQLAPKLQLTYAGPGYVVTDYVIDSTLVPGGRPTGADSSPMFNALPIDAFQGRYRYEFHMSENPRAVTPSVVIQRISVTTRQPLTASGRVWPVIGQVAPTHQGDHAAGTVLDGLLLLSPLRVGDQGELGWPVEPGQEVAAGTTFEAAVVPIQQKDSAAVVASMGFRGEKPYELELSRGTLVETAMVVRLQAEAHSVSGRIEGAEMPVWWRGAMNRIPLRIEGLNPHWPCGIWYRSTGQIEPFALLDGVGFARLQVDADDAFHAGNLLLADHPGLVLAFAGEWTDESGRIEVHNPTDAPISAVVRTAAITGKAALNRAVEVPAGTSRMVEF